MSVVPRMYAIKNWTCPQCGGDCQIRELSWPALGPDYGGMEMLACTGVTCDLVFEKETGMLLGYQSNGEFVSLGTRERSS